MNQLNYERYKKEVMDDVADVLNEMQCQPILFIGSGFTKRYINGPSWEELLKILANNCPCIDKDFAYYKQIHKGDLKKIGSIFSDFYHKYAWGDGRDKFPEEYFSPKYPKDIYFKYEISRILSELVDNKDNIYGSEELNREIEAFKKIAAHSIITTNYDTLVEKLFPEYTPIIGQKIISANFLSIGEIFKIHGCVSEPESIVINKEDYERFDDNQKYLSAKLLTYFVEHPLLFIGYSAVDPNIRSILYDVSKMVGNADEIIKHIYILDWNNDINEDSYPARDRVISVGKDVDIRIKSISASSFEWVYNAFNQIGNLQKIDIKVLRSILARSVELVRSNIPRRHVEIDFKQLLNATESSESFAKLFGITSLDDPSKVNLEFKYSLTDVAQKLGYRTWHKADVLINKIKNEKGFDIKGSDNKYHLAVSVGSTIFHKYSDAFFEILLKVKNNETYDIEQ